MTTILRHRRTALLASAAQSKTRLALTFAAALALASLLLAPNAARAAECVNGGVGFNPAGDDGGGITNTACGNSATATGGASSAFGTSSSATGPASAAFGTNATANSAASSAIGANSSATKNGATAVGGGVLDGPAQGPEATGISSTAIGGAQYDGSGNGTGQGARAIGDYSTALGTGTVADGSASVAVGANSAVDGANSVAMGADNTVTGNNSGAFGTGNVVTGNGSFAIGDPNVVNGSGTFVLGNDNNVNVPNVAGFGDNIQVVGSNNTVASTANASGSSVLGLNNTVNATNAVAIGNGNTVTGANGIVVGHNSNVAGADAIAIGSGASAGFANSVAVGNGAQATRTNQVVLGTSDHTYTTPGITSAASRAAQTGPLEIVSSDGSGNLAGRSLAELGIASTSDIAGINARLDDLGTRSTRAFTGVAMAFAMAGAPTVLPHERVAFSFNWGNFQGQNALALTGAIKLHENIQLNAGVGYGTNQNLVGGRAGIRVGW